MFTLSVYILRGTFIGVGAQEDSTFGFWFGFTLAEINVIFTLNCCNFNSGAPETFVSVVNPFYCSVIASKYGLPRLGKFGREFSEA